MRSQSLFCLGWRPEIIVYCMKPKKKILEISSALGAHYKSTFSKHGASALGVDWPSKEGMDLRFSKTLRLMNPCSSDYSVLDVGCGYGAFYEYLLAQNFKGLYTGIDIVPELVEEGRRRNPSASFVCGDFLADEKIPKADFVVCSGILTQKLNADVVAMEEYARALISKMYLQANRAAVSNFLSEYVDFKSTENFYSNASTWLEEALKYSRNVVVDHDTPFFEFFLSIHRR